MSVIFSSSGFWFPMAETSGSQHINQATGVEELLDQVGPDLWLSKSAGTCEPVTYPGYIWCFNSRYYKLGIGT